MMLVRSATLADLEAIYALAQGSGVGLTTFSKDHAVLEKRLSLAAASFQKDIETPHHEHYLFVLEDPLTQKIVGTSAIKAINGGDETVYNYQVVKHQTHSSMLNTHTEFEILRLRKNSLHHSELCTLYLDPAYRRHHNGMLLSRSRFLFIAQHPNRFTQKIIAEMRGVADESGHSPFWDAVGQHFFKLSFAEADKLSALGNKEFIETLMPKHPLYIQLLSPEAQAVIGQPHPLTAPAMSILLQEGFAYNHYVDIFDAGPTIAAFKKQILTIKNSQRRTVKDIAEHAGEQRFLLANTNKAFRASIAAVAETSDKGLVIDKQTADMLALNRGDTIILSPL